MSQITAAAGTNTTRGEPGPRSLGLDHAELFHLGEDVDNPQISAIRPLTNRMMKISSVTLLERTVNGQPGLVAQLGGVTVAVYAFEIAGDPIQCIWAMLKPRQAPAMGRRPMRRAARLCPGCQVLRAGRVLRVCTLLTLQSRSWWRSQTATPPF